MKQISEKIDLKRIKELREVVPVYQDLRCDGNVWLRRAFRDSGLLRVPRENQVRGALARVIKKKRLCTRPEYVKS